MIAFLIMAHAEPQLLRRLVYSLSAPWVRCFIHIDAKADLTPFSEVLAGVPNVTFITTRVPVYWGGWSQVEATLGLIHAATQDPSIQRFALISGGCYPVKSNIALRDFLLADDAEHLSMVRMPNAQVHKPLTRLTKWRFEGGDRVPGLKARAIQAINKLALFAPSRNIKAGLGDRVPHAGSNWWVLTRRAVETVLQAVAEQPQLVALYRYSFCPDESFFHTVLANSPLAGNIRKNLTFADWSRPERPCLIDESHLPQLLDPTHRDTDAFGTGPIFFARKFSSKNAHVLDMIDAARQG